MTTARLALLLCAAGLGSACTRTVVVVPPPEDRGPSTAVTLGIPPGHLPRAGECRIWIPGTPPGRQPRPRSRPCAGIASIAPAGSWIVYRPTRDRRLVHVRVVDQRRPGVIVIVRVFEVETGRFVRDERPEPEPLDEQPRERPRDERPRDERPGERPREERPRDERPQERPREERREDRPGPGTAATLGIPPGHLPQPGECRIWIPGTPPGQQPHAASRDCAGIARNAPAGSWIVYRPTRDHKLVHVRVVDQRRAGVVVIVRVFEVESGRFVREEGPENEPPRIEGPVLQRPPTDLPRDTQPQPKRPPDRPQPDRPQPDRPQPDQPKPEQPKPEQPKPDRPQPDRPQPDRPQPDRPQPEPLQPGRPGAGGPATLEVPPGHLPQPGECRIWIPGTPAGRQPRDQSSDCDGITRGAPAGSWVVYRPTTDRKVVHVRVVDERRPGVVVVVRVYDADSGRLLREENP